MNLFPDLSSQSDDRLRRLATYASSSVAFILIGAKVLAFLLTDSVALLSSTVDSFMDLLASLVTAYGVARALEPPDHEHRFGHGKAEPLAALTEAAFIAGSSFLLVMEAIDRFGSSRPIQNTPAGYIVMGIATVLTVGLLVFQSYVIRRTNAMAIKADRLHYASDVLINLTVIATFALQEKLNLFWIDPLFALLIAATLLRGAYQIARQALDIMMDRELPEEERQKIMAAALKVPGVWGLHDLRTRSDSTKTFIEAHVEMAPTLSLLESHVIAHDVIDKLHENWPDADITIHQDPAGIEEDRLDARLPPPL